MSTRVNRKITSKEDFFIKLLKLRKNLLFELPRPLGRGIMLTMSLALATFKAHMGLKPKFWMIIIPRPKGRGNAAFMLRNFSL